MSLPGRRAHPGRVRSLPGPGNAPWRCVRPLVWVLSTDKAPLLGVGALVAGQAIGLRKGTTAALVRADPGLFSGMNPVVSFQVAALCKGESTVGIRADKAPLSCMASGV